ncbi:cyclin-K [Sodiomyces alkalinus F11]|uniref:RNA polymerase II holoenzyme cyclin-like subunit n=1 Tax=Sodiomyces alkalinus (strain CBS 110278 / VKM F-3762 / F11) TaxID=1314773 RepID=A0A3N2PSC9_SODAK|nr:cyclin-K [Sodiomyces alkalinus F11]ROT37429.1 cyclin-K [Sodiomyces alkalinus F11]
MANIDRWRPPREGYQPPTVVAVPRPTSSSRSPVRQQRDVPPAVPSPPTSSSRTSPPRSQSRRDAQPSQPSPHSRPQTPLPLGQRQWYFDADEIASTPTIIDGISPAEERLRRAKGVNFIYQAGVMLDLPQITMWVAGVFFHRFYMRYSMVEEKGGIHHYNIAAAALFLANKTEENCRKTKNIIITVAKVAQKNTKLIIDEQSKEYWRWRDNILAYEELMLELLTFDLMVDNPYQRMFEMLRHLNVVQNKNLRHSAWAFCNDACLTSIPLILDARDIAITAIFFASVHTAQQISDVGDQAWWKAIDADESKCTLGITMMRQFYAENPLQKRNRSLPSPAFDIESTRRPKDPPPGDNLSSTAGTPRDADRSVGGRDDAVQAESGSQPAAKDAARTNGNGVVSPASKRKDVDSDIDGRDSKRARLSDEDEGEVLES